eukprot:GFKZ01009116.1.p1 GENE.GFKZ01009116.1~~GFKZ01009116.1.p1  ORF type:complete len:458 (+),score=50.75 GFKZ01009116.1:109-1374(+)
MLIHARLHTGETPYVCKYAGCGRSYKWLSSINFHEGRCQHKHMGLAVPAPRPPPPPAAAEAARVAAAAAAAAAVANPPASAVSTAVPSNLAAPHAAPAPHASHFTPLPPPLQSPLPSYHALHSVTQGRTPSPPPPPPPLRPPPPFAHQHAHHAQMNQHLMTHPSLRPVTTPSPSAPVGMGQPESGTSPSHPGGMGMLGGGVLDLPQGGGFPLRPKGQRFRNDFLHSHPTSSASQHQTSLSQDLLIMHTQSSPHPGIPSGTTVPPQTAVRTDIPPRAKKMKMRHPRAVNTSTRSDRPITPIKAKVRDGGPGSPESVSPKELRDILAPHMNSMVSQNAAAETDARHAMSGGVVNGVSNGTGAMQGGLETIGEGFGLENEILLANCSIGAVFDELAAAGTSDDYTMNQLEAVPAESGNPIELFQ